MKNTNVLVIDGDIEFLASAGALLNSMPSVKSVFCAVTMDTAETEILIHDPDFIIADLGFRDIGLILYESKGGTNSPFILMTSFYDNNDYLKLSRKFGANAFCLKDNIKEAIPHLLAYIYKGINSSIINNKYYLLK